jgi:hypothetical protein
MMCRPEKEENGKRISGIRVLWNEFDPIGVTVIGELEDEYDSYLGPTLHLLEQKASNDELRRYIASVIFERMGFNENKAWHDRIGNFIKKLQKWYEENWPNTHV